LLRLRVPRGPADIPQLAALKYRDYRNTLLANMFSSAGMWTTIVAIGWLVLKETDSSGWVGVVTFASMLPFLIVSPIGGLLGDLYDRRNLAMVMFISSSAIIGTMAVLVATGTAQLWHIAALAFVAGVFRSIQEPAMQALIPNQVPRDVLLNALVLQGATRHSALFFGLAVAAPLLAVDSIGVSGVLALGAIFHALGAVQMVRTRTVSSGRVRPELSFLRNMLDGLVYIYTHHAMALFIILVAFHCALVMSFNSILPAYSKDSLGATDGSVFGYLVMGFGAGAMAGTLAIAGVRGERRRGQLLVLAGLASGITPVMLALGGTVPLAVLFAAGMGASQATFMALTNTYVQLMAPDRLRARISGLYLLHAGGIMAFANLGYGFMADLITAPPILITTGVLFLVVMIGLGVAQPILWRVYRTGQVVAVQP
jgi:MFS family permease